MALRDTGAPRRPRPDFIDIAPLLNLTRTTARKCSKMVLWKGAKRHWQQLVPWTRGTPSLTRQLTPFVFVRCRDHHFNVLACKPLSLSGIMAADSCYDFGMCRDHSGNDAGIDGDAI